MCVDICTYTEHESENGNETKGKYTLLDIGSNAMNEQIRFEITYTSQSKSECCEQMWASKGNEMNKSVYECMRAFMWTICWFIWYDYEHVFVYIFECVCYAE